MRVNVFQYHPNLKHTFMLFCITLYFYLPLKYMDGVLIEQVRKYALLYDQSHTEYRDQQVRQATWDKIGKELGITGHRAKERWDNLRRSFCNVRNRRREETRQGVSRIRRTLWRYERQISFIIPFLETRKKYVSNCLNNSASVMNDTLDTPDLVEMSELDVNNEPGPSDLYINTGNEIIRDDHKDNDLETLEPDVKPFQNKKLRMIDEEMVRNSEERTNETTPSSVLDAMDDTDMFFLSMSKMTKKLPKAEQARIKLALSNLVFSAEIKCNEQLESGSQATE